MAGIVAAAPPAPGVLFYASFDGDAFEYEDMGPVVDNRPHPGRAGQFPNADYAVGDPVPTNTVMASFVPAGRFGGAVRVEGDRRGQLAFDAVGNVLARRGTIALWIQFEEPLSGIRNRPFWVSETQRLMGRDFFLRFCTGGPRLGPSLTTTRGRERRLRGRPASIAWTDRFVRWNPEPEPAPGEWQHLAVAWDEAVGWRTYWNGELVSFSRRATHRFPALDQISLGAFCNPRFNIANPSAHSFDELWVFDYPLTDGQIATLMQENRPPEERASPSDEALAARQAWWREHFSLDGEGIPEWEGGVLVARQTFVARALAVMHDTRLPLDGKISNVWPLGYHYYSTDGEELPLEFGETAEFDYVRARGSIQGELHAGGRAVADLPGSPFVQRLRLREPVATERVVLKRGDGHLNEIEFYQLATRADGEFDMPEGGLRLFPAVAKDLGELGEPGRRIAAYYPPEERTALLAGADAAEGALDVAAWTPYHLVAEPFAEDAGIGQVLFDLHLEGFGAGAAFVLRLYDPVTHHRVPWEFDFRLAEDAGDTQRVRVLWDGPGMLAEAGRRLWFTLLSDRPGRMLLGPGRTSLALRGSVEEQKERHLAVKERLLCNYFELLSEARQWVQQRGYPRTQWKGTGELMDLCEHVLHFEPMHPTAGGVYSWLLQFAFRAERGLRGTGWSPEAKARYVGADPFEGMTPEPPDRPENAPDWAVYGREALKRLRPFAEWWIHNRQAPHGEFGSLLGDDTCMVNDWVNLSLIHDPGGHLREGLRKLADFCWETDMKRGLQARGPTDHTHAYERGTIIQPSLALLYYGEPEYVERLMTISGNYDGHLTAINPQGRRLFRSQYFSADEVREGPEHGYDRGQCAIFQGGCFLVWYNGNPGVLQILQEWMDGWLGRSAGQPARDFFGPPIDFATGEPTRSRDRYVRGGPTGIWEHLYFLYRKTREERYLEPVAINFRAGVVPWRASAASWLQWRKLAPDEEVDAAVAALLGLEEEDGEGMVGDLRGRPARLAWKLTGDRGVWMDTLKDIILHMKKYLPIHTSVGQSTDRVSIPQVPMAEMFLGGSASRAKSQYFHHHAVSWEGADDDVARFVVDHGPKHLKALLYSFHDEPQGVMMRVWALEHGRYRVRVGLDTDGDETVGEVKKDAEKRLFRYEPVRFRVPPQQTVVVEIAQLEQYGPIQDLPDLAVGEARVIEYGPNAHLAVTVHNIGGAASPPATVRLLRNGEVLAERALPPVKAPLDLRPRRVVVRFPDVRETAGLAVEVRPEGDAPEITKVNNVRILD